MNLEILFHLALEEAHAGLIASPGRFLQIKWVYTLSKWPLAPCLAAAWQSAHFSSNIIAHRLLFIYAAPTAARLLVCFSDAGAIDLDRLLLAEEGVLLLERKAYMYSIPAATLSSGVSSRSGVEEGDDGALERELWRELWAEWALYAGGGAVGSLKGLLKMIAWLEVCGGGEVAWWADLWLGSCVCWRGSGCECGWRRGFACAMSVRIGPWGRGWPQL